MTNRQRFHATLEANPEIDRSPVIEWASWWDKTIREWEQDGLTQNLSTQELFSEFDLDKTVQFWLSPYTKDRPAKTSHGAPSITDQASYHAYKKYLYPDNAVELILDRINAAMPSYIDGSAIIWYTLEGFFWFPRELFGIENHLFSFYDQPELYHEICEDLLTWQLAMVDELAKHFHADFMTVAEDMSYNLGPMISEEMFEEFMMPYYQRLLPAVKQYGTKVIVDSDGDVTDAVPWFIKAGVEGILPLEHQAGVNILKLQQQFPQFCWVGGFDKLCLLKDKAAIDHEIERILPCLRQGRFLPSVDHQTPPGVTMENYRYYVQQMKRIATQACKDC